MKKISKRKIKRYKDWTVRFFKGMIIALAFIIPGVSSGVLAAILGVYEKLISFLANLTKGFKENFLFFLPIGIGGILSLALFSIPLGYLLDNFQIMVLWGFAGVIIGTIPALYKKSALKKKRNTKNILTLAITTIVTFSLLYFMSDLIGTIPANFLGFLIAGGVIALGVLIPGLSTSSLLLILGIFYPMLSGLREFDMTGVYLPLAIGGGAGMLLFSKIICKLFERNKTESYLVILGLVVASTILILIPPVADYRGVTMINIIVSIILFAIGFLLGGQMSKLEKKYK